MSPGFFKRVSVIGLGYIGLPTAAIFASREIEVVGVDINRRAVDTINSGKIHIVEPGLEAVVRSAVKRQHLRATTEPETADAFLIAVPTPFNGTGFEPDLSYVRAACEAIAPVLEKGNLIVLESTSPVGTTEKMAHWLAAARPDLVFPEHGGQQGDIDIAYCPERVLPGNVMRELVSNDRIIGGLGKRASNRASALYKTFVQGDCIVTNARTAELAKLTENSFRDVNIAFANELSLVCDRLDIDVWELIHLANRHPRVNILQPGPGVGGHCIAVDPWFIVYSAPDETRLIRTAREVNDRKPEWVLEKIRAAIGAALLARPATSAAQLPVACYGLAFKPDIDDLRESPALEIARRLATEHPGPLLLVEPNIDALPSGLEGASHVTIETAHREAAVHVMLVDHREFKRSGVPSGECVDVRGVWTGADALGSQAAA
ncbi:UDP-N-acetyl-D-mannosamine dehydrogenase [Oricola sp.]|uniref:UDP-N-acetyl-D-mannosamine dehydrogenase n=1 Tax=Oricola sp. TaxID=1979950 RepID=UPI003BABF909